MKTLTRNYFTLALLAGLVVLGGCSDPAADKDQAEVTEAIDIPQEEEAAAEPTAETGEEASTEAMPEEATEEPAGDATVYAISSDSYIGFTGSKKPVGQHSGDFREFDGTVAVSGDDLTTAKIKIEFQTASLDTDDSRLTGVLKGEAFFESDQHPTATFESATVEATDDGYKVTGNLTIRGVSKGVSFPADIAIDGGEITASAEFTIDRNAWDIGNGWVSDTVINDDVIIELDIIAEAGA